MTEDPTKSAESLPVPFGYIGQSMLRRPPPGTSQTFMGTFEEMHNSVPVYRGDAFYKLRAQIDALRIENERLRREAQESALQYLSDNGQWIEETGRLRLALAEVCRVLKTNTTAIVDTVWVSTGSPETLLDHCLAALKAGKETT